MNNADFEFLSLLDRQGMDADNFGDPDRRLFPILSQEDVDKAPKRVRRATGVAKLKERIISIAKRKGFTLPDEWATVKASADFSGNTAQEKETAKMVEFALDNDATTNTKDGEYVLRTGKIFEAGDYPDKNFQLTPEEMMEAIDDFQPVDLDLEHMPTIMDGKLGKLEAVALGDDGWSMVGTVRLPKWLDENVLKDTERKVSATWDRSTKKLTKLALVLNPRVSDAALMAAFAANEVAGGTKLEETVRTVMTSWFEKNAADFAHKTYDGLSVLQSIHDRAAGAGAICTEPKKEEKKVTYSEHEVLEILSNEISEFVSGNESKLIQQIHDSAVRGGARCSSVGDNSYPYFNKAGEKSDNKEETDTMSIKAIKDFFMGLPDDFDPSQVKNTAKEATDAAALAAAKEKEAKESAAAAAALAVAPAPQKPAAVVAVDVVENKATEPSAREKELEAELAKLRENEVKREAETFADAEIKAERAYPAEREVLISLFSQAAKDDIAIKTEVAFKNGDKDETGSRVDALKALYSVRKPHNLTKEELVSMGAGVLQTKTGDDTDYIAEAEKQAREYAARKNKGSK